MTPWTVAHQAPLFMGFSRQEYWSGLPCPPPGDLSDPGIEPMSLTTPALADGFLTTAPPVLTTLQTDLSRMSEKMREAVFLQKSKNITIKVFKCNHYYSREKHSNILKL